MAEHAWRTTHTPAVGTPVTPAPFGIEVHRLLSGVLLVEVRGPVDTITGAELQGRLAHVALAGQQGSPRLLMDLSAVTYLDRGGLDAVLQLQERWSSAGGTVELVAPLPAVVRLLHEADLNGSSWMTDSDESAENDSPIP
jgi:anti-sigma B factor antagonist